MEHLATCELLWACILWGMRGPTDDEDRPLLVRMISRPSPSDRTLSRRGRAIETVAESGEDVATVEPTLTGLSICAFDTVSKGHGDWGLRTLTDEAIGTDNPS